MKSRWRSAVTVAAFAALLWPAVRAQAACTTSLADPACSNELKCQQKVAIAAQTYMAGVQKQLSGYVGKSQSGGMPAPKYHCVGGPNSGKACVATNGVCQVNPKGKLCSADADCNGTSGSCNRAVNTGCNTGGPDNVGECQVDQSKNAYTKAIAAAQSKLLKDITTACITPGISAATVGLGDLTDCPGAAASANLPDDAGAFKALVECIEESVGGDLTTGNTTDAPMLAFQVSTGTGGVNGGLPPNNKFNHPPRLLLQLGGTQTLQLGTVAPSTKGLSAGGNITPINLAHCVGGNGNGSCVNDVDCGTNAGGAVGVCTNNTVTAGEMAVTGAPVFNPADPESIGPTLSETASCSGGVPTCLVTHTKNSGNGTTTVGSINLLTGHYSAASPIATDVHITGFNVTCSTFQPCPVCNATTKRCEGTQANVAAPCTAGDQSVTIECQPTGTVNATIPNPFVLSSDVKIMTPGAPGNLFCGFCDSSASNGCQGASMCTHGCQTFNTPGTQNCVGVTGATVCDFTKTTAGFLGDTSVTSIQAPGTSHEYFPVVSGIFCAGISNNPTVDLAAGLPSPVRVNIPYAFGYVEQAK